MLQVTVHEALFKLTAAEQVIKNSELSLDRTLAEADLTRALGKLRYLNTIAAARKRAAAAAVATKGTGSAAASAAAAGSSAAPAAAMAKPRQDQQSALPAAAPGATPDAISPREAAVAAALKRAGAAAAGPGGAGVDSQGQQAADGEQKAQLPAQQLQQQQPGMETALQPVLTREGPSEPPPALADASGPLGSDIAEHCPICHDPVETAAAVLPCGHILCCSCADALVARLPPMLPQPQRRISCPTCRCRTHVSDVAYVDNGRSSTYTYVRTDSSMPGQDGPGSPAAAAAPVRRASSDDASRAVGGGAAGGGRRRSSDSAGGHSSRSSSSYPWQAEQQLVVQGSYGIKIEAIVRRLLLLLQLDPGNKVIVFSSWPDVLDILRHALSANGIDHAFGRGRKGFLQALEQFKGSAVSAADAGMAAAGSVAGKRQRPSAQQWQDDEEEDEDDDEDLVIQAEGLDHKIGADQSAAGGDAADTAAGNTTVPARPPAAAAAAMRSSLAAAGGASVSGRGRPRVLLMLVAHGAAGLNLTEAQHVVLVEPLLDPAQELQATGRISRFGQTATTHVHRYARSILVWVCAACLPAFMCVLTVPKCQ